MRKKRGSSNGDGGRLIPGEDVASLNDLADDAAARNARDYMFAMVLDTTLETAGESDPIVVGGLDWSGTGAMLVKKLFLSRRDGVPVVVPSAAPAAAAVKIMGRSDQILPPTAHDLEPDNERGIRGVGAGL